ncbi:LLM class flavin-dependent oxidoreductase [Planococcus koreensis]|uniref:LLM class flavin-dependent oxidoreductase n=1 Tax=Planococcus koreensis TaxID=112331 RepID=UPI0039FC4D6F
MTKQKQMQLALQMVSGYGGEFSAWRMPGTDPAAYTNMDNYVERAKIAEKGKFQMIFIADTPALTVDLGPQTPSFPMDPMLALMAVARETEHIGLVATYSTTFNYPYNIARQFKALDVISHGRVGWNAVTSSTPAAAANFGMQVASRQERYAMAHESIQIVQALWGSWGRRLYLGCSRREICRYGKNSAGQSSRTVLRFPRPIANPSFRARAAGDFPSWRRS